jgi:hypothetical protein
MIYCAQKTKICNMVLDPTVAPSLLAPEYATPPCATLLYAAKMYIVSVSEKVDRVGLDNGYGRSIPLPVPDDVLHSPMLNQQSSFNRLKFLTSSIQAARE